MSRKQYLINKLPKVTIDDMSYWEEVMDLFSPTEVKEMRSRCLKGFGAEYGKKITSFDRFKTKYNEEDLKTFIVRKYYGEIDKSPIEIDNLYNHFFNKHRDGYVGWTEEDEEDYHFFLMFGCMPNDPITHIRTASDESHFAAEQGEMRGGFGLGYDDEEDYDNNDEFY